MVHVTIPEHYQHAVIPHIVVNGAAEAIRFYTVAFGASEYFRLENDAGRIVHAEIGIHGHTLMLGDADAPFSPPGATGASVALHVYVPDVDGLTARAVSAGRRAPLATGRHALRGQAGHAAGSLRPRVDLPDTHRRYRRMRDERTAIQEQTFATATGTGASKPRSPSRPCGRS
jgi:PhnB protein